MKIDFNIDQNSNHKFLKFSQNSYETSIRSVDRGALLFILEVFSTIHIILELLNLNTAYGALYQTSLDRDTKACSTGVKPRTLN
jgi:hypothetical protein